MVDGIFPSKENCVVVALAIDIHEQFLDELPEFRRSTLEVMR